MDQSVTNKKSSRVVKLKSRKQERLRESFDMALNRRKRILEEKDEDEVD